MIIGVLKEIKNNENWVVIILVGVVLFVGIGYCVLIENEVGIGSNFINEDYVKVGVEIVEIVVDVWV